MITYNTEEQLKADLNKEGDLIKPNEDLLIAFQYQGYHDIKCKALFGNDISLTQGHIIAKEIEVTHLKAADVICDSFSSHCAQVNNLTAKIKVEVASIQCNSLRTEFFSWKLYYLIFNSLKAFKIVHKENNYKTYKYVETN